LDKNKFNFKSTELTKIAKSHSYADKSFISKLCKDLKSIAVMNVKDMYYWESIDQENMPEIESLDHADLKAKNAFTKYFQDLLVRMSYAEI
jgi:formate dehydrogenase maturation protein FdhE